MPTKRVKRTPTRVALSEAALAAWRIGDFHALNRALGVTPHEVSPFDADDYADDAIVPESRRLPRARELAATLLAQAGPPGGVGRHGEPLGPGVPDYIDDEPRQAPPRGSRDIP
jgi:hypothetical protein